MKNFLLFFLLISTSSLSRAQTTTWGVNISPNISYRVAPVPAASPLAESVQSGERAMHTFDFGLDIRTQWGKRFTIGSGLFYSQKGFANRYVAAAYHQPTLGRSYIIDFVQDYLDIPIFLTYTLVQSDRFRGYALAGVNNSLLLHEKNDVAVRSAELTVDKVSTEVNELLRQPYLGASRLHSLGVLGGIGVRAPVDAKTFVGLEAVGKLMLTPLDDYTSASQRRQYSIGLNFRFVRTIR